MDLKMVSKAAAAIIIAAVAISLPGAVASQTSTGISSEEDDRIYDSNYLDMPETETLKEKNSIRKTIVKIFGIAYLLCYGLVITGVILFGVRTPKEKVRRGGER